jgi:hypothetical protein
MQKTLRQRHLQYSQHTESGASLLWLLPAAKQNSADFDGKSVVSREVGDFRHVGHSSQDGLIRTRFHTVNHFWPIGLMVYTSWDGGRQFELLCSSEF